MLCGQEVNVCMAGKIVIPCITSFTPEWYRGMCIAKKAKQTTFTLRLLHLLISSATHRQSVNAINSHLPNVVMLHRQCPASRPVHTSAWPQCRHGVLHPTTSKQQLSKAPKNSPKIAQDNSKVGQMTDVSNVDYHQKYSKNWASQITKTK